MSNSTVNVSMNPIYTLTLTLSATQAQELMESIYEARNYVDNNWRSNPAHLLDIEDSLQEALNYDR